MKLEAKLGTTAVAEPREGYWPGREQGVRLRLQDQSWGATITCLAPIYGSLKTVGTLPYRSPQGQEICLSLLHS